VSEQTSILETLTDEERQAAETFVREQRAAQQRTLAGRALVDDFITSRNERAEGKPSPLTTGQRWHNVPR